VKLASRTILALSLALAVPGTASAATTIGSSMPAFTGDTLVCDDADGCTLVPTSIAGKPVVMPFDGVLMSWAAQVPSGESWIRLRVLRPAGGGTFKGVGNPHLAFPDADGRISETPRLAVRAGDLIAVDLRDGQEIGVSPHATADSASQTFIPVLGSAEARAPDQTHVDDFEMLFNAVIEPDRDRDGSGDETEDACPELAETSFRCYGLARLGLVPSGAGSLTKNREAVVMAGERFSINATVRPDHYRLPDAALKFTLPPELRAVGATGPCSIAPGQVSCRFGQVAAKAAVNASVELEAIRPGSYRFLPPSPPQARFDVALTTGLPGGPIRRTVFVRVLAPGDCANPTPISDFEPASFGGDRLVGGPNIDRINALGGDDCISGKGHDDVLAGGDGDDRIDGGDGKDTLRGEAGADTLIGGPSRDRLEGGAGSDRIRAVDRERDVVRCGSGRDRVTVDTIDSVSGCERVKRVGPAKKKRRRR
jgi:hypothetical protein